VQGLVWYKFFFKCHAIVTVHLVNYRVVQESSPLRQILTRVATNLEYSGISLNVENSGNSVQPHGKIVTNKVFSVRHSNICVKQLLTGETGSYCWSWCGMTPDEGHYSFCCDNLWKSKFMALEKPGKLGFFSPTLWPPCWLIFTIW